MTAPANRQPAGREQLTDIAGVAELLGVEVRHVRRLVHERRIPYLMWGRLLRFDPAEVDAWLNGARVPVERSLAPGR